MTVTRTNTSYYEETGKKLNNASFIKLFNILKDHDGTKFMNIFRSFNTNDDIVNDATFYNTYEVGNDEWWDNISYNVYGTPFLWWIITLMNEVVNPFEELNDGDFIKYLREEYLYALLRDMESISSL